MSKFSEEMNPWIDQDGLIGSSAHPPKWSTGNGLLETSIAIAMEIELNRSRSDISFLRRLVNGIEACRISETSFNKNPGRFDQITHDDLLAVASTQRLASTSFATHIVKYGQRNGWDLSNNGEKYWDAQAKPWDVAFYELSASKSTSMYNKGCLFTYILSSATAGALTKGNPGSHRLLWIQLLSIEGASPWLDLAIHIWRASMNNKYKTVGNMMKAYYSEPDHPFDIFGQQLKF